MSKLCIRQAFNVHNRFASNFIMKSKTNSRNLNTFVDRKWKTISKAPNNSTIFTLMSYNILAQQYVISQPHLYVGHDKNHLNWTHRFTALKSDIAVVAPDILCLQEVQENHFNEISTHFINRGFDTELYKKRTGTKPDGCAIFYKKDLLQLIEFQYVDYFQPNIQILNRCNIAIIAKFALKSCPQKEFVVSTTHLLFNPNRDDIRLAQTQILLAELDRIAREINNHSKLVPIILTGDFNASQNSNVFHLLIGKKVQQKSLPIQIGISDDCQHFDVVQGHRYRTALHTENQSNSNLCKSIECRQITNDEIQKSTLRFNTGSITHKLNLRPTCFEQQPFRINNASTFHNNWIMVDYIFCSNGRLNLLANYLLPTLHQCERAGPIPNRYFGSDHYCCAARFSI